VPDLANGRRLPIRGSDLASLPRSFWWAILVASLLSLARFSPAFLILKAHEIGTDAAFVPAILVVMYSIYSLAAYPFGILADHASRRMQPGIGAVILIGADMVVAAANTIWWTALGAALWGLQLGITQGLIGATIANAATDRLRGTASGVYDIAIGVTAFGASEAGVIWTVGSPTVAFVVGACIVASAGVLLLLRPLPGRVSAPS
jgi:MFS family permease